MLEEEAVVVALKGELAEVEATPRSACGACSARKGCGTSLVASFLPGRRRRFLARNPVAAQPGERVVVGFDENALQLASLLLYLVPLFGLIGGALLGRALATRLASADGELLSILLGAGGLAFALWQVRRWTSGLEGRFRAVVLRRLGPATVALELPERR